MVRKETCPVCKGNKIVELEPRPGVKSLRTCNGCNGAGYQVRMVHNAGCSARY